MPEYLDSMGNRLRDGFNQPRPDLGLPYTACVGYGCRTLVTFDARGRSATRWR